MGEGLFFVGGRRNREDDGDDAVESESDGVVVGEFRAGERRERVEGDAEPTGAPEHLAPTPQQGLGARRSNRRSAAGESKQQAGAAGESKQQHNAASVCEPHAGMTLRGCH
jgi:hypothetical protein